jgi:hypothetical protein
MLKQAGGAPSTRRGAKEKRNRALLVLFGFVLIAALYFTSQETDVVAVISDTRHWNPGGCLVKAQNDDQLFVGTYRDEDTTHRVLLHSSTGQRIAHWPHAPASLLTCIEPSRFAVLTSTQQIFVFEGSDNTLIANLPGEVLTIAGNSECVAVRTTADQDHILPYPGRQAAGCRPEPMYPPIYLRGRGVCHPTRPFALRSELGVSALTSQDDEDGGLRIVGQRGEGEGWHKPVQFQCLPGNDPHVGMAHSTDTVFLVVGSAEDAERPVLLVLNGGTGETLAEHPLPSIHPPVHSLQFNGNVLIIEAFDAVAGIDPVSGQVLWTFGVAGPTS